MIAILAKLIQLIEMVMLTKDINLPQITRVKLSKTVSNKKELLSNKIQTLNKMVLLTSPT